MKDRSFLILLWEKGAKDTSTIGVAPVNVSTKQASQSNEQAGSASNHNNISAGKVSETSNMVQGNSEELLTKK